MSHHAQHREENSPVWDNSRWLCEKAIKQEPRSVCGAESLRSYIVDSMTNMNLLLPQDPLHISWPATLYSTGEVVGGA